MMPPTIVCSLLRLLPWPSCDLTLPLCALPPAFSAHGTVTARTRPGGEGASRGPSPPAPLEPATALWPRAAAMVVRPGHRGFPHPPPAPGMGQHCLRPGHPRGAMPWIPAPPGPPGRGLEWVVCAGTALFGCPPSIAPVAPSSGPRGPLWAKLCSGGAPKSSWQAPPAGRPQRRPPLHVVLVPGGHVVGGDRRGAVSANPARPGGAVGRPPLLLATPPTPPPHPLRGRDGRRPAPHRGDGLVGPSVGQQPRPLATPQPGAHGSLAGGGQRGARPPPHVLRRLMGHPAGARGDAYHGPVAGHPPPR